MNDDHTFENTSASKPEGRFNRWGERKLLTVPVDREKVVTQELLKFNGSFRAKSLFWSARLTGSKGIEFVFMSNAQFPPVLYEKNQIHLVPCFTPLNPLNPQTEERQAAMMKWGQFIYDGWIPNVDMSPASLDEIVSKLDDLVSLFSIIGNYFAYWEPKYFHTTSPTPSQIAAQSDFEALARSMFITDNLPTPDKIALSRSLAWLSNSLRNQHVQRFLLLFLCIESLATYIESSKTPIVSVLRRIFASQKLAEAERNKSRDECIKTIFSGENAYTAAKIQKAYFECINHSIKDMLTDHLNRVFQNADASNLMFSERTDGKSLWNLRNDIAHGSLNLLSEIDSHYISNHVGELEVIARNYLRRIFTTLAQSEYFPTPRRPVLTISFANAIGTPGTQFTPTDMAEYYANVEALSKSFLRVGFEP
jgi:hypothetical protein